MDLDSTARWVGQATRRGIPLVCLLKGVLDEVTRVKRNQKIHAGVESRQSAEAVSS